MTRDLKHQTQTVQAGISTDTQYGAVVPPLYLSSNFTFDGYGGKRQFDYTRSGNPTRSQLADALARLEGGFGACVTSSGMSAIAVALHLLEPNDILVAPHDCYGGTYRLMTALSKKGRFKVRFVDQTDGLKLGEALSDDVKMVWIETPSNPLLRVVDIEAVASAARKVGAYVCVDNTFLSPVWQHPIALGADIVIHSTTKYLNGHSDVVGGAVVASRQDLHDEIQWWANCLGLTGTPFDSFLCLRGLRTLHARMRAHEENALTVLDALKSHGAVSKIYHPSIKGHAGHKVAIRQQTGFGAMVSFELQGDEHTIERFLDALQLFTLAESLGGVESLVAHPATMTHASMDEQARHAAGIKNTLLRLSVGIEAPDDLARDLLTALDFSQARSTICRVV